MITCYSDLPSLEDAFCKLEIDLVENTDVEYALNRAELSQLLKSSMIKLDAHPDDELRLLAHPILKMLAKSNKLRLAKEQFRFLEQNNELGFFKSISEPIAFLLLNNKSEKKLNQYIRYSGLHCLNINSDLSILTEVKVKDFNKEIQYQNWDFAKPFLIPYHSIVIADPNLYKKETLDSVKNLLLNTLSITLKVKCTITLIGKTRGRGIHEEPNRLLNNVDAFKADLLSSFKGNEPEIEHFFTDEEDFHDRYIITNNTSIFSGYGLDIIKNGKVTKDSTWIAFKPFKRLNIDGRRGALFYEVMLGKLKTFKTWIKEPSKNALLSNIVTGG